MARVVLMDDAGAPAKLGALGLSPLPPCSPVKACALISPPGSLPNGVRLAAEAKDAVTPTNAAAAAKAAATVRMDPRPRAMSCAFIFFPLTDTDNRQTAKSR